MALTLESLNTKSNANKTPLGLSSRNGYQIPSFSHNSKTVAFAMVKLKRFFYKNVLRPLFFTSRLGRKVVLGHPGRGLFVDYIYENRPAGYTGIGGLLDRVLLKLPTAQATQHKFKKLSKMIEVEIAKNLTSGKMTRIVDLGSGPARYLVKIAKKESYRKEYFQALCLDIDRNSIRAGKQLGQGLPIEYRIGDITQLDPYQRLAERNGWRPNLVTVSTCYDFLDDSKTRKSLEELYHSLEAGGIVIIVSQVRNPSRALLRGVRFSNRGADTPVRYREPHEIKKWLQESGYKEITVELDTWGMYCFYTGRKTGNYSATRTSDIPVFTKGHEYRRVQNMRSKDAYQYMRGFTPLAGGKGLRGNKPVILMATNDYLGLRFHPKVIEAAIDAVKKYGASTTSSRILSGNLDLHEELQSRLASFLETEDVLVLSSGYTTNLGVMTAMLGADDIALVDRQTHASLLDGCTLAGGNTRFFAHNNSENLEKLLQEYEGKKNRLIVCDGIYSMDGDLAPLPEIFRLAEQYDAGLIIDDGHATGVFGKKGRGTLEHFEIANRERCLLTGSLGKAIGSTGGFVAGNREVIDYLRHTARSLLFSTALPPVCAGAAIASVKIINSEPERIRQLWTNTLQMRRGLIDLGYNVGAGDSPLIPVIIGDEYTVYKMSVALEEAGVVIDGVAPPAVKQNQCRLRIKMMATHTDNDIALALELLKKLGKRFGVI